ncbi:MAG: hypothetical protein A2Y62_08975 [Candidatus Fischerbacteria bacterium RBG_13_37_8]|uniref:FHA domain-containing protein n=1 Tax=Candidatus Fischerbacteria bacterium RBG_13_37_8 TaxID=1817863 RepID=A0A1F5VUR5_9BACT|nr:MAG: hypothetical protein A2Y62_08975 [Candidatus Fischerbacteria bacterium RBG_13_37_8]
MAILVYMITIEGVEKEYSYEITDDETIIGRGKDSHIVLKDERASRHHASINKIAEGHLLVDNSSLNGILLQNKKVKKHLLRHGDVFQIGGSSFQYFMTEDEKSIEEAEQKNDDAQSYDVSSISTTACPGCGAAVPQAYKFCLDCGKPIVEETLIAPTTMVTRKKSRSYAWLALIIILTVVILSTMGILLILNPEILSSASNFFSPQSAVAAIAPELAPYNNLAELHSNPQLFSAGSDGGTATLNDGARVEIPPGVLNQSTEFKSAIIDLKMQQLTEDISSARVYMLSTEVPTGQLSEPVILELPSPVSSRYSIAEYRDSAWQPIKFQEGTNPRIEIFSFSRHYYVALNWNDAPVTAPNTMQDMDFTMPATDISSRDSSSSDFNIVTTGVTQVLSPSITEQTSNYLTKFLDWYQNNNFNQVISLGNPTTLQNALINNLDIQIDPDFNMGGKYYPYNARFFGGAGPLQIRNNLLVVKSLRNDYNQLKTLWHELIHHVIKLQGGAECGQEETYTELIENRADWLGYAQAFDKTLSSLQSLSVEQCRELQRRWDGLAKKWGDFEGNHLSGPFRWQDPGGATCGENDRTYTITPDYIQKMDSKLGISVDINKIRSLYESKIKSLASSGGTGNTSDCNLRDITPPPQQQDAATQTGALPSQPDATPQPTAQPPQEPPKEQPCPIVEPVKQRCKWSPDGYQVLPCKPAFCFDTGPRGSYICVQAEPVPNARRTYTGHLICSDGFKTITDKCSGLITQCVPQ